MLFDAVQSSSTQPYISKEGVENLNLQWAYILLQYNISFPVQREYLEPDILNKI